MPVKTRAELDRFLEHVRAEIIKLAQLPGCNALTLTVHATGEGCDHE